MRSTKTNPRRTLPASLKLDARERALLRRSRDVLVRSFDATELILFGSKARGDFDAESDIDVLVLTRHRLSRAERHAMVDRLYEIGLQCGAFLSPLAVSVDEWQNGPFSVLPIKAEIEAQGVVV